VATMIELILTDSKATKIYINAERIVTVCSWNGKTELQLEGGFEYTVAETPEQVLRMIPCDDEITQARIIMENNLKLQYQHR